MKKTKNFTTSFIFLGIASISFGFAAKNLIPYSSIIGWGLAIVFFIAASISAAKKP